jgi:hypothetical protein
MELVNETEFRAAPGAELMTMSNPPAASGKVMPVGFHEIKETGWTAAQYASIAAVSASPLSAGGRVAVEVRILGARTAPASAPLVGTLQPGRVAGSPG